MRHYTSNIFYRMFKKYFFINIYTIKYTHTILVVMFLMSLRFHSNFCNVRAIFFVVCSSNIINILFIGAFFVHVLGRILSPLIFFRIVF